jgi:hypothetical protein
MTLTIVPEILIPQLYLVYLMSSRVNWAFFLTSGPFLNASETSVLKAHECQKMRKK